MCNEYRAISLNNNFCLSGPFKTIGLPAASKQLNPLNLKKQKDIKER